MAGAIRLGLLSFALLSAGCAREIPLEEKGCPCAEGFVCCEALQVCRPAGALCAEPSTVDAAADLPPPPEEPDAPLADLVDPEVAPEAEPACAVPPADYCTEIPGLPARPAIDGTLECGLGKRPLAPQGWTGMVPIPAGIAAHYAVAWRPEGLYLYVEVTTPVRRPFGMPGKGDTFHCGDAVELFVDADGVYGMPPAYDGPGAVQLVVQAPAEGERERRGGWSWRGGVTRGEWTGDYKVVALADGYAVEALLLPVDLGLTTWPLTRGGRVGFDVEIDVGGRGDPSCPRLGQFALRVASAGACVRPFCNVLAFCTPTLR